MKLRKLTKAELKAKAKKYAPYVQAVISVATTAAAAYYMRENNRLKDKIEMRDYIDENAWPAIEISPKALEDVENGATLLLRQYSPEPGRKIVQFTTREGGFPPEADETFNKFNKTAGTTTLPEN